MLILVTELRDNKKPECFLIRSFRSVSIQNWDGAFATLSMEFFYKYFISRKKSIYYLEQNLKSYMY